MLSRLRGTLSHNLRIEGRGTEERQTAMIGSRVSKLMEHILHMEMIFKLCLLRKAKGVLENWWGASSSREQSQGCTGILERTS